MPFGSPEVGQIQSQTETPIAFSTGLSLVSLLHQPLVLLWLLPRWLTFTTVSL